MKIKIHEFTGEYAISSETGQKIYEQIQPSLSEGKSVELDFTDVKVFVSAFFNLAVGQLLKDISSEELNKLLIFDHLNQSGKDILRKVIDNAKQYYRDSERKIAVDTVIEDYALSFEG